MCRISLEHLRVAAGQRHDECAIGIEKLARVGWAIPCGLERKREMALIITQHLVTIASPAFGGREGLREIQLMLQVDPQIQLAQRVLGNAVPAVQM